MPGSSDAEIAGGPWALVTGGSRGIGASVCVALAQRGWNVALWYLRDEVSATHVAQAVIDHGAEALVCRVHVGNRADVEAALEVLFERTNSVRGLVHCAGLGALAPTLGARPNRWSLAWDVHVGGLLSILELGHERLQTPASVVAVSSDGVQRVLPGYASLASAKASLESLVRYLAADLAGKDIRVNAVRAGPVDTDSLKSFPWYEEVVRKSVESPAGRIGEPGDIARIVAFLLGDDSRWIRGQVLVADGGLGLM